MARRDPLRQLDRTHVRCHHDGAMQLAITECGDENRRGG
jgi:hypothetical protein